MLTRRQLVAVKQESTAGTKEALTATEAQQLAIDPSFTPDSAVVKRPAMARLGNYRGVAGLRNGSASFMTELQPGGPGSFMAALLPAAGFVESPGGTWNLTSLAANYKTVTLGHFIDGRRYDLFGAVGNATFQFNVGETAKVNWEFQGKYDDETQALLSPPGLGTDSPVLFQGATLTLGGSNYTIASVEINLNNEIYLRPSAADAQGIIAGIITARNVTVAVDIEASTAKSWWSDYEDNDVAALSLAIADGGNTLTVTASEMQLQDAPAPKDRNGVWAYDLMFQCNGEDDELTLVWA